MSRAKAATVASAIACAAICWESRGRLAAQQPQTPPAFEVASVRRNTAVEGRTLMDGSGGRYTVTNAPLRMLLLIAYEIVPGSPVNGISISNGILIPLRQIPSARRSSPRCKNSSG